MKKLKVMLCGSFCVCDYRRKRVCVFRAGKGGRGVKTRGRLSAHGAK